MSRKNGTSLIRDAFGRHEEVCHKTLAEAVPEVERAAEVILAAVRGGGKILVCGNGGSAADAQHFAAEFLCRYKNDRRPLAAVALTVDTSALTAIANDYGFEYVFARQVEALGAHGDVLVAITTSGKSPNVLRAMDAAKKKELKIVALTGARGGALDGLADVAIKIPSEETARVQEMHELVIHAWCEFVDENLP